MFRWICDCGKKTRHRDTTRIQCRKCWGINRPNRKQVGKGRVYKAKKS